MKQQRNFTLIELLVVIAILGALVAALAGGLSGAMGKKDSIVCKTNLKTLGTAMIEYSLDWNFFPCGTKDTDSDNTISRRVKDSSKRRSTLLTFKTFKTYDAQDLKQDRFFCPASGARVPRKTTTVLGRDNIGYHYVNGDASTRVLKSDQGLIRDLNEGHNDVKEGNVLYASGAVVTLRKSGSLRKSSIGVNYSRNWYNNRDVFSNYKSFDSYNKKVVAKRQDRPD
jgi:prepilin-type N-terminal cleavage/methylation domain-containing protein